MVPTFISVMEGRCPCCLKPICDSLTTKKDILFEQVKTLNPKAEDFHAGYLRRLFK
jgi:hypothetical protein